MRRLLFKLSRKYAFFNMIFNIIFSCDIPREVKIGDNVHFSHGYLGIVIHPKAIIGNNVCIQHHVLIGQRNGEDNTPIIHDSVVINPYVCICGAVDIGENSVIGVASLVLHDVPPNTVYYNKRQECYKDKVRKSA